jgi:hypothetical protein
MQYNTASYLLIVRGVHHYLHVKKNLRIAMALSETVNRRTTNTNIQGKITKKLETTKNDRYWATRISLTSRDDFDYSRRVSCSWSTSATGGENLNHLYGRKVSFLTDHYCQFWSACQVLKVWSGVHYGRERMVITITYVIGAYLHVGSNPAHGERHNIIWYSLSVTCDMSVVFSGYSASSTNKTVRNDIKKILLKVALNTIKPLNKSRSEVDPTIYVVFFFQTQ